MFWAIPNKAMMHKRMWLFLFLPCTVSWNQRLSLCTEAMHTSDHQLQPSFCSLYCCMIICTDTMTYRCMSLCPSAWHLQNWTWNASYWRILNSSYWCILNLYSQRAVYSFCQVPVLTVPNISQNAVSPQLFPFLFFTLLT